MPDIYSALKPVYLVSKVLGLIPYNYGHTSSNTTIRSFLRIVYSGIVFNLVLLWYVSSITFDSLYHYTNHSIMFIIPMVSKMSTIFGATLAALIICHRGTLQRLCKKLLLIDQILLVPQESYKRRRLLQTAEIIAVFSATGVMHVLDMQDRNMSYITVMEISGWVLSSYINNTIILQFLNCVRILNNRFQKLNAQLSAMVVHGFEEEELGSFISHLNSPDRHLSHSTAEGRFVRGRHVASGFLSLNVDHGKTRGRVFIYDPVQIHTLRLTQSMLYQLTRVINSDFGIQILLEMLHSFISLIMAMYIAMTGRPDPNLRYCGEGTDCFRVVIHFCLVAVCITKFVAITAFCHVASSEMTRTPELVRRLLLPRPLGTNALTELQLFSQQMSNMDAKFTAFGFFTLNLELLSSLAAAATTYIVILIQSKPPT